jgi:ribosomal protein RSM22 (predicted rRNA methylase)
LRSAGPVPVVRMSASRDVKTMSPDLPSDLRAALDQLIEGRARGQLAQRAGAISDAYRAGGGSEAIASADDALAYALARLPATYAAATAVLSAVVQAHPDFAPHTLIDAGAGPGTATFAAAQCYRSLQRFDLIDHNPHLQRLAKSLLAACAYPALQDAQYDRGEACARLASRAPADLVLASYLVGEVGPDRLAEAAEALWSRTAGVLAVIEPGTPAGFARIAALRAHLIARGAHVLAPCPHQLRCPIVPPDWCHFAQRLNRSRHHRHIKCAELSYEDEKFSYVVLAHGVSSRTFGARVLAPPRVGKVAVTAKLCTQNGSIAMDTAQRRNRDVYKAHKAWRWGEAVDDGTDDRDG